MRSIKALSAALAILLIVFAPPLLLLRYIGDPYPPEGVDLTSRLTDNAILGLIAVLVWIAWAQLTLSLIVETYAALTDRPVAVRLPVFGFQQDFAHALVATILTTAALTPLALTITSSPAHAAPPPPPKLAVSSTTTDASTPTASTGHIGNAEIQSPDAQPTARASDARITITVQRGDSLWSLAETHLGKGERWTEIAHANTGHMMGDGTTFAAAELIRPGWHLTIPGISPTTSERADHYTVKAGDTLWEIADEQLDDPTRYPEIFAANQGITQPGGATLTDADHIDVGWDLRIPTDDTTNPPTSAPRHRVPANHEQAASPARAGQPPAANRPDSSPTTSEPTQRGDLAEAGGVQPETQAAANVDNADNPAGDVGISALRALLATAGCLAFGVLGLVTINRRRQFRERRPGRTIAATPPELVDVEQAVVEHGNGAQSDVEFLDRAMRHLAACCRADGTTLPQLGAAVLAEDDLTLLFTQPTLASAPTGWSATDDRRAWMLPRRTFLEEDLLTQAAPYPALVTIGLDDRDRTWLLDLEILGVFGIDGPRELVADMTRFLVAELAVNAWSEGTEVLLAEGFAAETVALNPVRVRQVDREVALRRAEVLADEAQIGEANTGTDVLTLRRDGELLDSTGPVVIVVPGRVEGEIVDTIGARNRTRVVVLQGDPVSPASPVIELADDGMANLSLWGVNVRAFTLSESDAAAMSALVASSRNLADEQVPAPTDQSGPLGKYAKADGSLREEFTTPRHTEDHDDSSLLPQPDEVYLANSATTTEDLAVLAPSVPEVTRDELEAIDPVLDEDIADWLDPESLRPKVHLLGPVDVTAVKGSRDGISNLAGTIELIVYLACQERGVTGERAAEAFGWKTVKTVQNRAIDARRLLGTRPDGSDWLPDATTTESAKRGVPTYEIDKGTGGVLVDADLLVRLKFRAQKRGDESVGDLVTALTLVQGEPFDNLRRGGYGWLFGGQRHDQIMVAAIHDAAHVLATRAVSEGRTDLVRHACAAARMANPHSDVAWLDLAAAAEVEGGRSAADELARELVLDRVDEDLPARTEAVLDRRGWLTA